MGRIRTEQGGRAPAARVGLLLGALALLSALAGVAFAAGGGWVMRTSPTTQDLHAVAMPDVTHAWAAGDGGTVVSTADGGATWAVENSGTVQDLRGIAAADAAHAWAVGDGGTIVSTADGGATWTSQPSNTGHDLFAVSFSDTLHGWAAGAGGTILSTTDGGVTWVTQPSGVTSDLHGISAADANHVWAVGDGGTIVSTSDGGAGWTKQESGTTQDLAGVTARGTLAWAVGAGGTILGTQDAGRTWSVLASPNDNDLAAVTFTDGRRGWVAGAAGTILVSADAGATWTVQASDSEADLHALVFADAHRGLAIGAGGVILATAAGGVADTVAPVTSATGLSPDGTSAWGNTDRTVTLRAKDADSGVAATYYSVDGGPQQTYTGPFSISEAGSHLVTYRSIDRAGNLEPKRSGYVNIDTGRPVCRVFADLSGRPGTVVKFRYRIDDPAPSCGTAAVTISIYRGQRAVKRVQIPGVPTGANQVRAYTLGLTAGTYRWVVTATDAAGNRQSSYGTGKLTVKPWPLPTTRAVQRRLVALRYLPPGAVTGVNDYRTQQAVIAFQAWSGLTRDGVVGGKTNVRLANAAPPEPRPVAALGHYVQIFRARGVALFVNNGALVRAVHCSTGKPGFTTPAGQFSVYFKSIRHWSEQYSCWMPYASFFHGGVGLHAYDFVPAYPASHGCVRLPNPEAAWAYAFTPLGTPVYVY